MILDQVIQYLIGWADRLADGPTGLETWTADLIKGHAHRYSTLFVWPKRNCCQNTDGIDLSTITITIGKPNGKAQATSEMTQAVYFRDQSRVLREKRKDY
jgi:hypothetical protein